MFTADMFPVYAPRVLPKAEPFVSCRRSCKGCGKATAARMAAQVVTSEPFARALSASLHHSVCSHAYAHDSIAIKSILEEYFSLVDTINRAAGEKSKSGHKAIPKPVIGISRHIIESDYLALAGLLENSPPALYLCFDNEAYIDDFIRRAGVQSFTVNDARHPASQQDIDQMIAEKNRPTAFSHGSFSYCATACPSFPFDYIDKIKKGISCAGNACILVLTPCPTGWIFPPKLTHAMGIHAVQTGYFPLYEIAGDRLTVNQQLVKRKPAQQFLALQRRFMPLPATFIPCLQNAIDSFCDEFLKLKLTVTT